jgi:hypothetical protein
MKLDFESYIPEAANRGIAVNVGLYLSAISTVFSGASLFVGK